MKTVLKLTFVIVVCFPSIIMGQKIEKGKTPLELRKERLITKKSSDFNKKLVSIQQKEITLQELKKSNFVFESDLHISFLNNELNKIKKNKKKRTARRSSNTRSSSVSSNYNWQEEEELTSQIDDLGKRAREACKKNPQICDKLAMVRSKPRGCPTGNCMPNWNKLDWLIYPHENFKMNIINKRKRTAGTLGNPIKIKGTDFYAFPIILKEKINGVHSIKIQGYDNLSKSNSYQIKGSL